MVKLYRSWNDKYHLPECKYKGVKAEVWVYAEGHKLEKIIERTYGNKGMIQPCLRCILTED